MEMSHVDLNETIQRHYMKQVHWQLLQGYKLQLLGERLVD